MDQELRDLYKSFVPLERVVISPARRLLYDIIETYALHLESIRPDDSGLFFFQNFRRHEYFVKPETPVLCCMSRLRCTSGIYKTCVTQNIPPTKGQHADVA